MHIAAKIREETIVEEKGQLRQNKKKLEQEKEKYKQYLNDPDIWEPFNINETVIIIGLEKAKQ